jgi:hypothetical protein
MPRLARVYRAASVVARTDGIDDLALIRLMTRDPLPGPLRICPPRLLPRARVVPVLTLGCDEGAAPSCTVDRAEKKPVRKPDGATGVPWEVIRKNTPGRSGGPLLDRRGYLLGIASGTNGSKGYFSQTDAIHAFLKRSGFQFLYEEASR